MNVPNHHSDSQWPAPWPDALRRMGFAQDNGCWRQNGLTFSKVDQWFKLESHSKVEQEISLLDQLGRRGLWRWLLAAGRRLQVFEFPGRAVLTGGDDEWSGEAEEASSPEVFLRWATASRGGELPADWRTPQRELVESWLPPAGLTVQCGPLVRQGELIVAPDRWAVRIPVLPRLPADLPAARRQWLDAVLNDALTQWRMVRVGLTSDLENPGVYAEADFTGGPASETLFSVGLDAVRHVVVWLAESVELLADATVASEVLASPPPPNPEPERTVP